MKNIMVTGGAGFIGSNFIRYMFRNHNDINIVNYDKLTYAGNLDNLRDIENKKEYKFIKGDISDFESAKKVIYENDIDTIVNFAAETHVDRSIMGATDFIKTDVEGVYVLLEIAREKGIERFIQISTDEVYGSIKEGFTDEKYPLMPRNPYSASKSGGDRLAYSYFTTYDVPVIITRASNNYGPYQYPEKLIPLFITNALAGKELPLYGDGLNIRDWLYVEDHCSAIDFLLKKGVNGEIYNIGGGNLYTNVDITNWILKLLDKPKTLIKKVKDRLGHDRRYALDCNKIFRLGWKPKMKLDTGLEFTVKWYCDNEDWWTKLKNQTFDSYYKKQYVEREK